MLVGVYLLLRWCDRTGVVVNVGGLLASSVTETFEQAGWDGAVCAIGTGIMVMLLSTPSGSA